jgi:HSP20 family protein
MTRLAFRRLSEEIPAVVAPSGPFWTPLDPFGDLGPIVERPQAVRLVPEFDVKETKDAFVFVGDMPGIADDDLEITMVGNRLTVSGKRCEELATIDDVYYARERASGSFTRTFTLPEGVDGSSLVRAALERGVLTLSLPKKSELCARRILLDSGRQDTFNRSAVPAARKGTTP